LIRDTRSGKRSDAERLLLSSEDESIRKLADIGRMVFSLTNGEVSRSLMKEVTSALATLPMSDYWAGIIEASGQAMMESALPLRDDDPEKAVLMEKGLEIAGFATSEGFPLKKATIEMIKKGRTCSATAGEMAGFILRNESSKPGTMPIMKKDEKRGGSGKPKRKSMLN
jgi:hypothetical protein